MEKVLLEWTGLEWRPLTGLCGCYYVSSDPKNKSFRMIMDHIELLPNFNYRGQLNAYVEFSLYLHCKM
jgi:hypothetical protein